MYTERGLRYNAAKHKAESMREKVDRLETFVNSLKHPVQEDTNGDAPDSQHDLAPIIGDLRLSETGSTRYISPVIISTTPN